MKALPLFLARLAAVVMLTPGVLHAVAENPGTGPENVAGLSGTDQLSLMKSMTQMKLIVGNCLLWAGDHGGRFPGELTELLTDRYLGKDQESLLRCPLVADAAKAGYYYYGARWSETVPDGKVLLLSRWTSTDGKHLIGRKNGSVALELPKQEDFLVISPVPDPSLKPTPEPVPAVEPKKPVPSPAARTPGVSASPTITLTAIVSPKAQADKRYKLSFPSSQMPAGRENYLWIVDPPSHVIETKPLTRENWLMHSSGPGLYKIHLEYRAGLDKHAASNTVEITVP